MTNNSDHINNPGKQSTARRHASAAPRQAQAQGAPAGTPAAARKSSKRTLLVVLGCVVVAAAAWLAIWLFACNGSSLYDLAAQNGQAPYKSQEEMQAELDRTVEEGMFNISIASVIRFENPSAEGIAYIENVPGNPYDMQVTITDDGTGEELYQSGILQPDQYIEKIALSRDVEPGTHETTATFTALDKTTHQEQGQAAAKVTLIVGDNASD